jgi:hypothetical protein
LASSACSDRRDSGKEIASELVVAGGDMSPILDVAEEVFDFAWVVVCRKYPGPLWFGHRGWLTPIAMGL